MFEPLRRRDAEYAPLRMANVLDPCCGSRMFWIDRDDPRVIFGDCRTESITVTDNSHGNASGVRHLEINPDMEMDFRALPFEDGRFNLVVFDPPHLRNAGPNSWLRAKYGVLGENWRDDLAQGFTECFRVLASNGVLIFKWAEVQIPLREVLALTPHKPLFGHTSGKRAGTHWMTFMKSPMAQQPMHKPSVDTSEGEHATTHANDHDDVRRGCTD